MKVYVVEVIPATSFCHISQEAYTTLKKAQDFIERRAGDPQPITDFHYRSGGCRDGIWYDYIDYLIFEVNVV